MYKLYLKPQAELDLEMIYKSGYEKWGIGQAEKYQDELFEGMELILENIELGAEYLYGTRSYRKLHLNRHLIFYRIDKMKCVVVRIFHDSMDIKSRMDSE